MNIVFEFDHFLWNNFAQKLCKFFSVLTTFFKTVKRFIEILVWLAVQDFYGVPTQAYEFVFLVQNIATVTALLSLKCPNRFNLICT